MLPLYRLQFRRLDKSTSRIGCHTKIPEQIRFPFTACIIAIRAEILPDLTMMDAVKV